MEVSEEAKLNELNLSLSLNQSHTDTHTERERKNSVGKYSPSHSMAQIIVQYIYNYHKLKKRITS